MPPLFKKYIWFSALVILCLALGSAPLRGDGVAARKVKIQIDPQVVTSRVSPDFIGFGYETSAVAQSNYFSPDHAPLVQFYRNLTTPGLPSQRHPWKAKIR